jgi:lysophospholipase L1-like esterase
MIPAPVRLRELLRSAALSAASLLVVFGVLEVGVRLFVPGKLWRFIDATTDWQLDKELGWVHRPNLDLEGRFDEQPIRFRTSRDGLIPFTAVPERASDTQLRVMVFGDSMVVGRRLPQDRIYTARLEALLREQGVRAEVINAGVQGYSTDQALLLMRRWLPVYQPDVVFYGSTFNDFGGNALDHAHGQAKPRYELDTRGRLNLEAPQLAEEMQRTGGLGFRSWIQHSAFYRVLQPRIHVLRARLFGFDERVLLGIYEEAYVDTRFARRFDWELFGAMLLRMRDTARSAHAQFVYFAHPEVGEVWEPYIESVCTQFSIPRRLYDPHAMERRALKIATERGIEVVPLIDAFRAAPQRGPFHLIASGDPHLSESGHALLAELLAARLVADREAQCAAGDSTRCR